MNSPEKENGMKRKIIKKFVFFARFQYKRDGRERKPNQLFWIGLIRRGRTVIKTIGKDIEKRRI